MRIIVTAAVLFAIVGQTGAQAAGQGASSPPEDRLLIVNGNSGRVIYDDGHDDLFCVTRRVTVGYDGHGDPIRRRRMHCR